MGWLKKLEKSAMQVWYIGRINFPSCTAINQGLGENYVAVTGDGLCAGVFEILSYEDDGVVRLHVTHKTTLTQYLHKRGIRHDTRLTFKRLVKVIANYSRLQNRPIRKIQKYQTQSFPQWLASLPKNS